MPKPVRIILTQNTHFPELPKNTEIMFNGFMVSFDNLHLEQGWALKRSGIYKLTWYQKIYYRTKFEWLNLKRRLPFFRKRE